MQVIKKVEGTREGASFSKLHAIKDMHTCSNALKLSHEMVRLVRILSRSNSVDENKPQSGVGKFDREVVTLGGGV